MSATDETDREILLGRLLQSVRAVHEIMQRQDEEAGHTYATKMAGLMPELKILYNAFVSYQKKSKIFDSQELHQ